MTLSPDPLLWKYSFLWHWLSDFANLALSMNLLMPLLLLFLFSLLLSCLFIVPSYNGTPENVFEEEKLLSNKFFDCGPHTVKLFFTVEMGITEKYFIITYRRTLSTIKPSNTKGPHKAQWIRWHPQSWSPGFNSEAYHQRFFRL